MEKLAALKEMLAQDPKNVLARYGLAIELGRAGELDAALAEFAALVAANPDYAAGYQMAAQMLAEAGRTAEAIERLKGGIAAAGRAGNRHAMSEMQTMLDELDR